MSKTKNKPGVSADRPNKSTDFSSLGDNPKKRSIALHYKSPPIPETTINLIYNLYHKGMELAIIARTVNGRINAESLRKGIPYLSLCDLYAIIQNGINPVVYPQSPVNRGQPTSAGYRNQPDSEINTVNGINSINPHSRPAVVIKLKQRTKHLTFELKIEEFAELYRGWRSGLSFHSLENNPDYKGSSIGKQRALKSISRRQAEHKATLTRIQDNFANEIISCMRLEDIYIASAASGNERRGAVNANFPGWEEGQRRAAGDCRSRGQGRTPRRR